MAAEPQGRKAGPPSPDSGEPTATGSAGVGSAGIGSAGVGSAGVDRRLMGAWRTWLASLATDADAAQAAAHLYGGLPPPARDAWLDALAQDAADVGVPAAAVYGPLLAVEPDRARQERIMRAAGIELGPVSTLRRALLGTAPGGVRICALVVPLYLDFVRVVVSRFVKDRGFDWVRQDPIVRDVDAPRAGCVLDGVQLFASAASVVVDELAHAVLAHRRNGHEAPPLLRQLSDLFSAQLDTDAPRVDGGGRRA